MRFKICSLPTYEDPTLQPSMYGLSCIVIIKCLASGIFRSLNRELFCAYFYLHSHYDFLHLAENTEYLVRQPFNIQQIESYVLSEKLGLDLVSYPVAGEFGSSIRHMLDQSYPIIVPTNIKKLPFENRYSEAFTYPLLITGYDTGAKALVIYDNRQNYSEEQRPSEDEGITYSEYLLEEDIVANAFYTCEPHYLFEKNTVHVLKPNGKDAIASAKEAINDIASLVASYKDHYMELLARKLTCLQLQCWSRDEAKQSLALKNELRYINSQRLIGEMLLRLCREMHQGTSLEVQIRQTNTMAWQAWKKLLVVLSLMNVHEHQGSQMIETLQHSVFAAEKNFLEIMSILPQGKI